jgi:chromosome segregation ATPase
MLFGKGGKDEASPDQLEGLLNSSFDRKLANLEARAPNIVKELQQSKQHFSDACREFEKLQIEPEKANMWINDVSVIKSQKNFYSTALNRIIADWNLSVLDAPNVYSKYSSILSNTEEFVNEVLKANKSFNKVLFSYSRYLDSFKRSFSLIERQTDNLRTELNRNEAEILEYNNLNSKINTLIGLKEESDTINKSISALNDRISSGNVESISAEESNIKDGISKKQAELTNTNSEMATLRNKINSVGMPLERPARKFDHISPKKHPLYSFLADPLSNIKNESDYGEFKALISELKKEVDTGSIDAKNIARINDTITQLLNTDIYNLILQFRALDEKKSSLESEIRFAEATLSRLRNDRTSSEMAAKDIESMKKSAQEFHTRLNQSKIVVEELFLRYYNKKVSIEDS